MNTSNVGKLEPVFAEDLQGLPEGSQQVPEAVGSREGTGIEEHIGNEPSTRTPPSYQRERYGMEGNALSQQEPAAAQPAAGQEGAEASAARQMARAHMMGALSNRRATQQPQTPGAILSTAAKTASEPSIPMPREAARARLMGTLGNRRAVQQQAGEQPSGTHSSGTSGLETVLQNPNVAKAVMRHLEIPDASRLSRVSKEARKQVNKKGNSVLPDLQSRKTVHGTDYWTTAPADSEKARYFTKMSAAGDASELPHITEVPTETHKSVHVTDLSIKEWKGKDLGMGFPDGKYPTKTFFHADPNPRKGPNILTLQRGGTQSKEAKQSRVLVKQGDIHVGTTDVELLKKGELDKQWQYPLSLEQQTQTLDDLNRRWGGQDIRERERPNSKSEPGEDS